MDGGYANRTFLRHLPERTVVVARLRKHAKLRVSLPPDQRTEAFAPLPAWRRQAPLRPFLRDLITLLRKEAADYVPHGPTALAA